MTEIQPSPPGYRGQDEAPGTTSCSPGSFKYTGHVHHGEQQQAIGSYVRNTGSPYSSQQDDFLQHKQSGVSTRATSPGEQQNHSSNGSYRRKSDSLNSRRTSSAQNDNNTILPLGETNNQSLEQKKATFAGYNETYKKNTPGYKNDSGYSESIGFDSFSLPLNERDDASPPPTPPVRDASSLKGVCYGPGHEKYPSWPSAPERHPDEELHENSSGHSGSHRSKSWTDHTNYPKEKPAQYTRPLAKRPNPAFTQQLKTVMERCEKIPVETFESRGSRGGNAVDEEPRLWPRVDREGKPLGDAEYVVPSPPEREQQQPSQTISHAELEAYVRSYQDPQVSQVDIYGESGLTQAGLEEYTRVQHSQQASYAQSEGYHSYVSSVDSTTNTPFLDRLRRDSEAVAQRPAPSWEEGSREGRDSVVTTSSGGSASSSETLKWHGSMSDVSVSGGLAIRQMPNDRWDRGSISDVSVNGLVAGSLKKSENSLENKWQNSMSDLSNSIMSPSKHNHHNNSSSSSSSSSGATSAGVNCNANNTSHNNNKWKQEKNNKWQASMNDRNCKDSSSTSTTSGRTSLPPVIGHCASLSDVCQASSTHEGKWQESSIDEETSERPKDSPRNWDSCLPVVDQERYNCTRAGPQSPTSRNQLENSATSLQSPEEWDPLHGSMSDVSQTNLPMQSSSKQLIAHSARVQTPQRHHSESVLYLDRERSQRNLYRLNSSQSQEPNVTSDFSSRRISESPQKQAHLSVAERISELEKQQQQQMRYTYLDPDKRHRVSDPTLKAIQKKALLSFYERHQSSWRSEPQLAQGNVPTAQSPPPQPPPRPRPSSSRRASSASDYSSGTWRDKTGRASNAGDLPSPKHQHSNSCGSLSMDLLGPVIVGPAISIDDWVPERPPKKPHLRAVYNDRVPSPDLPPPSPPTVTENEVLNCDDPLPPPPPELSDSGSNSGSNTTTAKETSGNDNVEEKKRHRTSQQPERQSTRRSKHGKRSERDERTSKSSPIGSPSKNTTAKPHDEVQQHFVRAITLKHAESGFIMENGVSAGLATHRMVATGRSSLRYPSTQKLMVNERNGQVKRVNAEERRFSSRPPARLPDLIAQRYSDSGNQRPAPQVPVESRIIRQESMRVESTRIDVSGLLRNDGNHRFESSSGQRPQPQVPKNLNGSEKIVYASSCQQHSTRPNYLALPTTESNKTKYSETTANHNYSVGSPVKTGYEASSKLLAEASPQKYHEPPKYVPGHHQRHGDNNHRNYYALPPKYNDAVKLNRSPGSPASPPPPPLAPRQNTPGRKSLPPPPRPAPPQALQGSQSKASYLAYRRERGAPDSEGSYKRTMSPTARLEDWQQQQQQQQHSSGSRDAEDPVLLRVTPQHPHQDQDQSQKQSSSPPQHQNHHGEYLQQPHQQQLSDLPKSHSVDALHQRIEERNTFYSSEVMGKLSHDLTKKLQATENRPRSESNNNNNTLNNNDTPAAPRHGHQDKRQKYKERLSPQSVQVLNDRNRQLERERRKLAASCEPVSQQSRLLTEASNNDGIEDFYRERSATIEMTSRNVELLNRRNALVEKRINGLTVNSSSSSSSVCPVKDSENDETVPIKNSNSSLRCKEKEDIRELEVDKPPAPVSSPPRTPDSEILRSQESLTSSQALGAIPRRSGSSSSSSSSEPIANFKSSSPRKSQSFGNEFTTGNNNEAIEAFCDEQTSDTIVTKSFNNSRRKISSPSQTENSWMRSNSPRARSSQTDDPNASIELGRIFSSRSRSSSLSSASKISSSSCSSLGSRFSPIEAKNSPRVSPQPGIEGLTMVQRSEIVLRVNAATSDASSQTEVFQEDENKENKEEIDCQVFPEPRSKLQEEIECEELSRDLASRLGPNDKLVPILVPAPEHKKPTDYVSGLFRVEATLQPRPRRPPSLDASNSVSVDTETDEDGKIERMHSTPTTPLSINEPSSPLSATSAYFTTSEGKARFLTRYSRDVTDDENSASSVNSTTVDANTSSNDSFHLRQKKEELVLRLDKKVVVLRAEQEAVREEGELNEALGARVATRVTAVARPAEASKYRLHVEEVGKITSLLLGLSGRLARAENALYGMPANHPERKILESKRDKLMDQLEEAKILKSNIDKRSVNVSAILAKYLNDEEYADYQHFINMKAKLIMDGREIQDKVKLGEEQLAALKEAIN